MAFNTPYKLFKRYASHEGGIADPCIVSWPDGLSARGQVRDNYAHVSDVTPTLYDLLGITGLDVVKGIRQIPLEGVSFAAALRDPGDSTGKDTQFYSMMGTRGIWHRGWFANTVHPPTTSAPRGWSHFGDDRWELFHIDADRSQLRDLADELPDKLGALKSLWHENAMRQHAYPLNDMSVFELIADGAFVAAGASEGRAVFYSGTPATHTSVRGLIRGRSFALRAVLSVDDPDAEGVLFSQGSRSGGHVLYIADRHLHYVCNTSGAEQTITSRTPVTPGRRSVGVKFARNGAIEGTFDVSGDVALYIDDDIVGSLGAVRMTGLDLMQTVSAGRSVAYSVSANYTSPYPYTGGVLEEVAIAFEDEAQRYPHVESDAAFTRD